MDHNSTGARKRGIMHVRTWRFILACIVCLVIAIPLTWRGGLLRCRVLDLLFYLRGAIKPVGCPHVALVLVDRTTLDHFGTRDMLPRSAYARAIEILAASDAHSVGVDVIMEEDDPENAIVAAAVRAHGAVVFASNRGHDGSFISSHRSILDSGARTGLVNYYEDIDGVLRHPNMGEMISQKMEWSLPLVLASGFLGADRETGVMARHDVIQITNPVETIELPQWGEAVYINYLGPPCTAFPSVSLKDIVSSDGAVPDELKAILDGKIVLIGFSTVTPLVADNHRTPFKRLRATPGVEVLAHVIENILCDLFIRRFAHREYLCGLLVLVGILSFCLFSLWSGRTAGLILLGQLVGFPVLSLYLFRENYFLDFVSVLVVVSSMFMLALIFRLFDSLAERNRVLGALSRYVAPGIAARICSDSDRDSLKTRKTIITIVFADIRGFTSLCENIDTRQIESFLNEYFERTTRIIFSQRGTLDKFIGDAVMALFGTPIQEHDDEIRAVACALQMREAVKELSDDWVARGLPKVDIGIGLNTGEVVAGNIGSDLHFEFTAVGDNVNLASRIASLAERGQILISESTFRAIQSQYATHLLPPARVKGKEKEIRVYEVLGEKRG